MAGKRSRRNQTGMVWRAAGLILDRETRWRFFVKVQNNQQSSSERNSYKQSICGIGKHRLPWRNLDSHSKTYLTTTGLNNDEAKQISKTFSNKASSTRPFLLGKITFKTRFRR